MRSRHRSTNLFETKVAGGGDRAICQTPAIISGQRSACYKTFSRQAIRLHDCWSGVHQTLPRRTDQIGYTATGAAVPFPGRSAGCCVHQKRGVTLAPDRAESGPAASRFCPPLPCPTRQRCAAAKPRRKPPFSIKAASRGSGLAPRKVAEILHAPVRKVCDYKMWVRCEASRPCDPAGFDAGAVAENGCGWGCRTDGSTGHQRVRFEGRWRQKDSARPSSRSGSRICDLNPMPEPSPQDRRSVPSR
jgi:hypothetical protein